MVHVCNTVTGSLDSYCLDLDFLGMEKIACGDDFRSLCSDWIRVGARELFWSSYCGFVCHFYLVASTAYAMQLRHAIPAILAQYKRPAPVEIVNSALKSDSPDSMKKQESASTNVRFTLPGRHRSESPVRCEGPQTPVTTRTLLSGESPDRSVDDGLDLVSVFSSLWGGESD